MENKIIDSSLADMKMSIQLLPLLAGAIRKLRTQKIADEKPPVVEVPKPISDGAKYTQNKWEVSPSG